MAPGFSQKTSMWEEHPAYQKFQVYTIGLLVFCVFINYLGSAIIDRDWELFKRTLLLSGSLLAAIGIFSGSAWILVRIFTCQRSRSSQSKKPPKG